MNRKQLEFLFLTGLQSPMESVRTELLLGLARSCHCFAGGPLLYEGISLTMNSKVLNGSQRVVMDGVISDDECRELQRLTNVSGTVTPCSLGAQPPLLCASWVLRFARLLLGALDPSDLSRPD